MPSSYIGDPYWLAARFDSTCSTCNGPIRKGERIFYYPKGKHACCAANGCADKAAADFRSAVADEDFCNGGY